MIGPLLSFAASNAVRDAKAVGSWLVRDVWRIATLGALIYIAVQHFQLIDARHDAAKWQKQAGAFKAQLEAISSKKAEQRVVTREKIKVVLQKQRQADAEAKKIERAPLPGNCKTPKEILDADI